MKATFSSAITLALLVLVTVSRAQNNRSTGTPDTLTTELHKKINPGHGIELPHGSERIKIKAATGVYLQSQFYNPYRLYNPPAIVISYTGLKNNYNEKNKPLLADLLRAILIDRAHKH